MGIYGLSNDNGNEVNEFFNAQTKGKMFMRIFFLQRCLGFTIWVFAINATSSAQSIPRLDSIRKRRPQGNNKAGFSDLQSENELEQRFPKNEKKHRRVASSAVSIITLENCAPLTNTEFEMGDSIVIGADILEKTKDSPDSSSLSSPDVFLKNQLPLDSQNQDSQFELPCSYTNVSDRPLLNPVENNTNIDKVYILIRRSQERRYRRFPLDPRPTENLLTYRIGFVPYKVDALYAWKILVVQKDGSEQSSVLQWFRVKGTPDITSDAVDNLATTQSPNFNASVLSVLSQSPSARPSARAAPSRRPSRRPSLKPSSQPSFQRSHRPSSRPSRKLTHKPSSRPVHRPSSKPSSGPSPKPSAIASESPSLTRSGKPSSHASYQPSRKPFNFPSSRPSRTPSSYPSILPSTSPSHSPTGAPSTGPTQNPTSNPTAQPSGAPSQRPDNNTYYGLQPSCSNKPDLISYNICLDLKSLSGKYETWMNSFGSAKRRWESIIIRGDSSPYVVTAGFLTLVQPATQAPKIIDDIYISGTEAVIDGVGGILGSAGPTLLKSVYDKIRKRTIYHTVGGWMKFDTADIAFRVKTKTFDAIVLHEMAHVLGIGSLWPNFDLVNGTFYVGQAVLDAWEAMGCGPGGRVPIEAGGPAGTAGGHWDEFCLTDELMTGYLNKVNFLSNLTISSLYDMGYIVNFSAADSFNLSHIRNASQCRDYCPGLARGRNLAEAKSFQVPPASSATREAAIRYGQKELEEAGLRYEQFQKSDRRNLEDDGNRSFIYLGSSMIKVFYVENGYLRSVTVTKEGGSNIMSRTGWP